MSVEAMSRVWKLKLTPAKKIVLLALTDHADQDGNGIRPSIPTIAWKTDYSENQVRRIIKQLVQDGLLIEKARPDGRPVLYSFSMTKGVVKEPRKQYGVGKTPTIAVIPPQDDTPTITVVAPPLPSNGSPTPTIAMVGKPSEQPSEQPSTARGQKAVVTFQDEWNQHLEMIAALVQAMKPEARGLMTSSDLVKAMTKSAKEPYLNAAKELDEIGFPSADVPALYQYVKGVTKTWSVPFGVKHLAKYASDYVSAKAAQPPPAPQGLDDFSKYRLEMMKQEKAEREAAS